MKTIKILGVIVGLITGASAFAELVTYTGECKTIDPTSEKVIGSFSIGAEPGYFKLQNINFTANNAKKYNVRAQISRSNNGLTRVDILFAPYEAGSETIAWAHGSALVSGNSLGLNAQVSEDPRDGKLSCGGTIK